MVQGLVSRRRCGISFDHSHFPYESLTDSDSPFPAGFWLSSFAVFCFVQTMSDTEPTSHFQLKKRSPSFFGPVKAAPTMKNIDKLKLQSSRNLLGSKELNYKPVVSQNFLEDWLNYPVDKSYI
jgi:hypothetical protein